MRLLFTDKVRSREIVIILHDQEWLSKVFLVVCCYLWLARFCMEFSYNCKQFQKFDFSHSWTLDLRFACPDLFKCTERKCCRGSTMLTLEKKCFMYVYVFIEYWNRLSFAQFHRLEKVSASLDNYDFVKIFGTALCCPSGENYKLQIISNFISFFIFQTISSQRMKMDRLRRWIFFSVLS